MNLILDPGSWQSFSHRHANSGLPLLEIKRMYLIEQAKFHEQVMTMQVAAEMAQGNGGGRPVGVIGIPGTTTTTTAAPTTSTTTTTTTPAPTTSTTTTTTTPAPTTTTTTTTTTSTTTTTTTAP